MEYPIRREYEMPIKSESGNLLGKILFKQPSAYEAMEVSNNMNDNKWLSDRLYNFIGESFIVNYPKRHKKWYMFGLVRTKRKIGLDKYYLSKAKELIYKNIGDISTKILKKYFERKGSIFDGIPYPKIKGDKSRSRNITFVEGLVMICNGDASRVEQTLKDHSFEQIDVLMDAKQLINNESVEQYHSVNDQALVGTNKRPSMHKDIKESIRAFKEKRRKLKENKSVA